MTPLRICESYEEVQLTFDTSIPETQQRDHEGKQKYYLRS